MEVRTRSLNSCELVVSRRQVSGAPTSFRHSTNRRTPGSLENVEHVSARPHTLPNPPSSKKLGPTLIGRRRTDVGGRAASRSAWCWTLHNTRSCRRTGVPKLPPRPSKTDPAALLLGAAYRSPSNGGAPCRLVTAYVRLDGLGELLAAALAPSPTYMSARSGS
jgi:hypothetical protein